jgi:diguanylate cyclase (GGDEF)-like protein
VSSGSTLIYQNDRTRVFRLAPTAERGSIICKERLGTDARARVRNEARILDRLTGIDGVARLSAALTTPTSIALEDNGGVALSQTLGAKPLEPATVVTMALRLARIVAAVHRRGVVHKNINPNSILVAERDQKLSLVDFDFATTFAEDRPGFVPHREIAGELPYLAPEQTGRTGRTVDYRADFYAMGATFYELATGHPPFGREDPLQLIHDHLARLPTPPVEVDDQIPSGLSDIIMRLLEKEPDQRYQSAEGLAHDLARLHQQLTRREVGGFQLGERDFPLRLSPPSRLFGRGAELDHLRTAFEKALRGEVAGIFITGPPGIGKTALIDELRPLVSGRRGWFLIGTFDQHGHDITSGPVVLVLRAIGRMLLAEPEATLVEERTRIIAALGPNAAFLAALLPEFAVLLGPPPQVGSRDPIEAEAQQRLALVDLLRVVTQARPVVIVLDGLQWAYQNSVRLIDALLTDGALSGLLLVCAYRDADLEVAASLNGMRAKWERLGVAPTVLRLRNLAAADLAGMLAEMLRLSPIEASRLAATLGARTSGNPFDTVELVNGLRREGLLVPSPDGWNWDDAAIQRYVAHGEADFLTSRLALTFASFGSHWFEPLENTLLLARRAREGLIRAGDLPFASLTYLTSLDVLSHCAPTLEAYATEVDAALAFAARTSNEHATAQLLIYRQLVRSLRGETHVPGGFSDATFDEVTHLGSLVANPATGVVFHAHLALAAALFGDAAKLAEHAAMAVPMLSYIHGLHSVLVHLLAALALAWRSAAAAAHEQANLLADLDHHRDFLARRAVDAPENLLHLVHFIDAERAWAAGDGWGAASAFDAARAAAPPHQRRWQQALIAERAGLCLIAQGLNHAGRDALTTSRQGYELWGASAKVKQLEHQHGFLRESKIAAANTAARLDNRFSSDAIDLFAVLRASQALSSHTSLETLQARIIELLEAMTGATTVLVALWRDDPPGWYLSTTGKETDMVCVEDAAARGLLPLTAVRYTERTREPLLVNDASRDYRFAADPYMTGLTCCSLLVVPVLSHGAPRALLLLENRLARGAFAIDRLEAVTLIAGQLAVSFDNALLYASLERRVADRTQALAEANARLEALSITDPLTGIANRRRFAQVLEAEWKRASRLRSSIGMVLVDVDHFKSYNDLYGHVAGDLCLRRVAEALSSAVRRDVDLVARYGGEEFALILPGADRAAVHRVGERARAVVAALEEPHPHVPGGFVTISAGVAAMVPSTENSAEELIECADAALYEAKGAGRNQVRDGDARLSSVNDVEV